MTATTHRARRRVTTVVAAGWLLASLLLAAARWPSWWAWIAPEQTPMTWLQSVALLLAGAFALVTAHLLALRLEAVPHHQPRGADAAHVGDAPSDTAPPARSRGAASDPSRWRLLALGLVALAVDERFALHERVRDGVLAPRDVTVPFLPWVGPGDFLLLAVGAVGLLVLPVVWRAMGDDAGARRALLLGVVLAVVAVGMDSIDPSTWTTSTERIQQTAEEVIEYGGTLALLAAVTLRLLGLLDAAATAAPDPAAPADAAAPPAVLDVTTTGEMAVPDAR